MHTGHKVLLAGDHFGELSMIFKCRRTSTVVCKNYITMAQMQYGHYREVVNEFPHFQKLLVQKTYDYMDPNRNFIMDVISVIPFMKDSLSLQSLNHLLYTLKWKEYDEGEHIQRNYDNADSIIIISKGLCEVYTYFESHQFVIEYLSVGAIINSRNFFLEDLAYVTIKCLKRTSVQILTREGYELICQEHEHFRI